MDSPEKGSKPSGFQVRIENPDLLFKAIKNGASGEIGKTLMESPIRDIEVNLTSGKDTFDLSAEIDLDSLWAMGPVKNPWTLSETIAKRFNFSFERGNHFAIEAPKGTKLVFTRRGALSNIVISTGEVEDLFSEKNRLVPPPSSTKEGFDVATEDLMEVLKKTVKTLYEIDGKLPPDEELVLRSPKVGANSKRGRGRGLFGEIKTPDDLIGKMEIQKPDVKFEDIGGQIEAKKEIQGLAFALKNPELYKKWGTNPPKGIILYGPSGTGKTLMAKALASQAEARFFHVEASDIASKWYGESEQIVKSIFDLAGQNGENTIIFFDEIDAIAPQREGAHEATQRILGTLLENMDGMASHNNVMVVASTNRLSSIEPALLRAGRFDRWVEVPLPDEEGRRQIFSIHMSKAEKIAGRSLFSGINLDAIIPNTEKSSGADIAEIVRRVLEEKVRQEGIGQDVGAVTTEDILRALKNYEKVKETKRTIGFARPQQEEKIIKE